MAVGRSGGNGWVWLVVVCGGWVGVVICGGCGWSYLAWLVMSDVWRDYMQVGDTCTCVGYCCS